MTSEMASDAIVPVRRNLGLPDSFCNVFLREGALARRTIAMITSLAEPIVRVLVLLLNQISSGVKHRLILLGWRFWVGLHKVLPAAAVRRGLSNTLSLEAHALSNIAWWARLVPLNAGLMRLALTQLDTLCPPSAGLKVEVVNEPAANVHGKYVHCAPSREAAPVIFWCYGGAFVGGSTDVNVGLAERWGRALSCDVFLVELGAYPEQTLQDIVRNGCRAYEWLLQTVDPSRIVFFGFSSGGGAAMRILQLAIAAPEEREGYFIGKDPIPMPAGVVLYGPFVDYLPDCPDRMMVNAEFDLVVSQRAIEAVAPIMDGICGGAHLRRPWSPLYQDMKGLCPMLVSVSQHEATWLQSEALVQRAREAGVNVELLTYPYQAHVFQLLTCFLPEAQQAEDDTFSWIKRQWGKQAWTLVPSS